LVTGDVGSEPVFPTSQALLTKYLSPVKGSNYFDTFKKLTIWLFNVRTINFQWRFIAGKIPSASICKWDIYTIAM
jgi:hypothetical protein